MRCLLKNVFARKRWHVGPEMLRKEPPGGTPASCVLAARGPPAIRASVEHLARSSSVGGGPAILDGHALTFRAHQGEGATIDADGIPVPSVVVRARIASAPRARQDPPEGLPFH